MLDSPKAVFYFGNSTNIQPGRDLTPLWQTVLVFTRREAICISDPCSASGPSFPGKAQHGNHSESLSPLSKSFNNWAYWEDVFMIVTHNEYIMKNLGDSRVEGHLSLIFENFFVENQNFYAIATTKVGYYSERRLVLKSVWKGLNADNKQVISRSDTVDLFLVCVCDCVCVFVFVYELRRQISKRLNVSIFQDFHQQLGGLIAKWKSLLRSSGWRLKVIIRIKINVSIHYPPVSWTEICYPSIYSYIQFWRQNKGTHECALLTYT